MSRDLVWVFDLAGDQVGALRDGLVELWHDERLDQSETFGLAVRADHPKAELLIEDVELRFRDRRYRIAEVLDERNGTEVYRRVTADALWYELGDSDVPGSTAIDDTVRNGLETILDGSRWTVGVRTDQGGDDYAIEETDRTRLALLRVWAKVTGLDVVFDTQARTVDLVADRGRELGLAFRYRRNLLSHKRRRRPPVATVLVPYGADDLTIAGVNGGDPSLSDFSFYTDRGLSLAQAEERFTRLQVWADSSFIREDNLLAAATARLAKLSTERVSYELGVVDLSELSGIPEQVEAGDKVRAADPDFDVDVRTTVVRFFRDFLDPTKNEVELSSLEDPLDLDSATSGRGQSGDAWELFLGPVRGDYQVRSDGSYILGRVPLRFRGGGRAHYSVDLKLVGVGAGTAHVSVVDASNGNEVIFREVDVAYTDGETVYARLSWGAEDLSGAYSYTLRATTTASGGAASTKGVNITADVEGEASFFVMAQGAVRETPTATNSQTFTYTGTVQTFTVPDSVTQITAEVAGSAGANGYGGTGGAGGILTASFDVTPGSVLDVYVGGQVRVFGGGNKGNVSGSQDGGNGGDYSAIVEQGGALSAPMLLAGGGGGSGGYNGGGGGYPNGEAGEDGPNNGAGQGGTQTAGGAGGVDSLAGGTGSALLGANAQNGGAFDEGGGGGGGGKYGGGGGSTTSVYGGGGGGGSGDVSGDAYDVEIVNGGNAGEGYVTFSWELPIV